MYLISCSQNVNVLIIDAIVVFYYLDILPKSLNGEKNQCLGRSACVLILVKIVMFSGHFTHRNL